MKTTIQKIVEDALIGKTLMSDGTHAQVKKIVGVKMDTGYDGEIAITLEDDIVLYVYGSINQLEFV